MDSVSNVMVIYTSTRNGKGGLGGWASGTYYFAFGNDDDEYDLTVLHPANGGIDMRAMRAIYYMDLV